VEQLLGQVDGPAYRTKHIDKKGHRVLLT